MSNHNDPDGPMFTLRDLVALLVAVQLYGEREGAKIAYGVADSFIAQRGGNCLIDLSVLGHVSTDVEGCVTTHKGEDVMDVEIDTGPLS